MRLLRPAASTRRRSSSRSWRESRSLDGMVTFLSRFFPYLADCEAVRYLLLASSDLLVATRIVVVDRRMKRFGSSGPAVEEALRSSDGP